MSQPRSGEARDGGGDGDATRARHSMAFRRGVVESLQRQSALKPLPLSSTDFLSVAGVSERRGSEAGHGRADWGQPICRAFAPGEVSAASHPRPRQLDPGAIGGRVSHLVPGADFRRIKFHLANGFWQAMFCKGTLGTWEQAISDRQKASPLKVASLFPAHLATLGTWEQNWPIPMQENPRACGYPLPPPAGELA